MSDSLRALLDSTPLGAGNAPYIESLYEQFLDDPASVEPKWRDYFGALMNSGGEAGGVGSHPLCRFQGIAGRYQPPHFVEAERFHRGQAHSAMSPMRRVEASAEESDAPCHRAFG